MSKRNGKNELHIPYEKLPCKNSFASKHDFSYESKCRKCV